MRRANATFKKIVFLFLIIFLLSSQIYVVSAKDIFVDINGTKDYTSIQSAIQNSSDGDIIYVNKGMYTENILIDKKIKVKGINSPTIFYSDISGPVVTIRTDSVDFSGFEIICNNNQGVRITSDLNIVTNCVISNASYGIYVFSSQSNTIKKNIINNSSIAGVYLFSSDKNNVLLNQINKNSNGLILQSSNNNHIIKNKIENNSERGVKFLSSKENIFEENLVGFNNITGFTAFLGSDNNSIFYNNFINNSQQAEDYADNYWSDIEKGYGNYWSKYEILYPNASAVGNVWDMAYNILRGDNKDTYSLVRPIKINFIDEESSLNNAKFEIDDSLDFNYVYLLVVLVVFILVLSYILKRRN